jgi:HEPN domain-containing protein
MDDEKIKEIQRWLIKSQHDLGSANRLMEGEEPYLDTAVYHCQQAAEKAIKAYLTYRDYN